MSQKVIDESDWDELREAVKCKSGVLADYVRDFISTFSGNEHMYLKREYHFEWDDDGNRALLVEDKPRTKDTRPLSYEIFGLSRSDFEEE